MNRNVFLLNAVRFLMILNLPIFFISCDNKPPDKPKGLRIESCPISYNLDGPDSLVIYFKVSPIDSPMYVWFKGTSGPDTFTSNYAKRHGPSSDSQLVYICWKPFSPISIPIAQYRIIGYMDKDSFDIRASYSSNYRLLNIYRSGLNPYVIIAYSGCNRTARQNDNLNDTVAFRIRARVEDTTGSGQNNKQVRFTTSKGKFVESGTDTWTTTTGVVWSFSGIAEATLKLSDLSGGSGGADYDYTVYATLWEYGDIKRTLRERCIIDNELSNLPFPYTHKRLNINNPASEIPGDNLPNFSAEDPRPDKKDVFVEVDYTAFSFDSSVRVTYIDSVCYYAEKALERGRVAGSSVFDSSGIDVHFLVDDVIYIPRIVTKEQIRGYLWSSRDSVKYIHCIIGNKFDEGNNDTLSGGCSLGWGFREFNWPYAQRMFNAGVLSSNEAIGNYRIDSMGCFVAMDRMKDACRTVNYRNTCEAVGVALAHEIGHALGLGHTPAMDSLNIMSATIDINVFWYFDKQGFFLLNRLYDSNPVEWPVNKYIFALDVLNKLGVETGSLMDHAFDRQQ